MKFRKRKTTSLPSAIIAAGGSESGLKEYLAINHSSLGIDQNTALSANIKMKHYLEYINTLPSKPTNPKISDIFRDNDEDYEEETAADAWLLHNDSIILGSEYTNVGIGINPNPLYNLDVYGNINFTGNLTKDGAAFSSYTNTDVEALLINQVSTGLNYDNTNKKLTCTITEYSDNNVRSLLNTNLSGGLKVTSGDVIIDGGVGVGSSGVLHVRQKGNTNSDGITLTSENETAHRIWKDVNGTLSIGTSTNTDTYQLRQDLNGNIGIGTAIDTNYKLNIGGNVNFTGDLTKDGINFTSYTDEDVETYVKEKGGEGIIYNTVTKKYDLENITVSGDDVTITNNLFVTGNITANSISVIDTDTNSPEMPLGTSLTEYIQQKIDEAIAPLLARIVILEG